MNLDCHPERSEMNSKALHSAQSTDPLFARMRRMTTNDERPTIND